MPETKQQELIFGVDSKSTMASESLEDQAWHQDNLDVVFPIIIIIAGLFQFVLRKWILPISDKTASELENQFPSQGLIYQPGLGLFLILIGAILLLIFQI